MTNNHGRAQPLPPAPVDKDLLTSCALLFSRAALLDIGLFDEQFFLYYEDNDWSLRACQRGWRLRLAPTAWLWHKESQSSGGLGSTGERYHMGKASVQFFRKHVRGTQWLTVFPYRLGSAFKTTLRLAQQGRLVAARAYWRGLWDGLRCQVRTEGSNCGANDDGSNNMPHVCLSTGNPPGRSP
ncbi:MAG: glycosyltransferase family 2 protein [Ardenticatenales bacterium]|nr:glycosyltransferase family 2 protein [Ardenticatenales bacterium]